MKDMFKEGDVVVVIFPDHGSRYMGKMYNDDWLRDRGFLKDEKLTARDIIKKKENQEIVTIDCEKTVSGGYQYHQIAQYFANTGYPKRHGDRQDNRKRYIECAAENPSLKSQPVKNITTAPFPFVDLNTSIDKISAMINKDNIAVLVEDNGQIEIITQYDSNT